MYIYDVPYTFLLWYYILYTMNDSILAFSIQNTEKRVKRNIIIELRLKQIDWTEFIRTKIKKKNNLN